MPKVFKLLFQAILTAAIIHSCVFAAEDGSYEIKSLSVKDSLSSVVISSSNRMQVSSISGTASLKHEENIVILDYSIKMSGIFLANPNLMQYSEIVGNHILKQTDDCINDNETAVKCSVPIEKNRTLHIVMEKMSAKR